MPTKALLIIDVQNDFCPGGSLAVPNGDEVIAPLNDLIKHAIAADWPVFASRDWHPEKTKHFESWPKHCVQETEGAAFHKDMRLDGAIVITKGADPDDDGYSAFDGFTADGKPLVDALRSLGVEAVYVGGLATDYCVKATALDAVRLGFKTELLADASRAVNIQPSDGAEAIDSMAKAGVIITDTAKALSE